MDSEPDAEVFKRVAAGFDSEVLARALAGDHEAGKAALHLCVGGLTAHNLTPVLSDYLADRLSAYLNGELLERALCVEQQRGAGRPADPLPKWKTELAAFDLLLERRGYAVEQRNDAMDRVRAMTNPKGRGIHRSDAVKVRAAYSSMRSIEDELLYHFAGSRLREILKEYKPR